MDREFPLTQSQSITIEITYGDFERQHIEVLEVPIGTTVRQALDLSTQLRQKFPAMNIDEKQIGIFSKHTTMDRVLEADNRIEIYRPLTIDPKVARKIRADKSKEKKA